MYAVLRLPATRHVLPWSGATDGCRVIVASLVRTVQTQAWWLVLLLGWSLPAVAQAKSLDQQVFQLQLVIDQIHLARSVGDRAGLCAESRRANHLLLDILPSLQQQRPGLNHAALQDTILLGFEAC